MRIIRFIKEYIFRVCPNCGHSLRNNKHGIDQGDLRITYEGHIEHTGNCTYCKECRYR